ncbi:hypothetical protein [Alienimonas californiensis]|uniref:Uncharacterized protein n=1 Tax=Alienimonas californiensis TaxID=2527989 RepID=A0A517P667_9PLAN|nr:hypothetical protein [Alienimonas californiensis]QDT14855.1 hypothetical protein CA12_09350 [Alienimonas californiensis]
MTAAPDLAPGADSAPAPILVTCACGRTMRAPRRMAGRTLRCPFCKRPLRIEPVDASPPGVDGVQFESTENLAEDGAAPATRAERFARVKQRVVDQGGLAGETADEGEAAGEQEPASAGEGPPSVLRRAFEALLDPRAVQWLLMLGGGLAVIGALVWLVSVGAFDNPRALAAGMIAATVAGLAAGWWVSLKTRYAVAGRALTSLACVVAPLILWFLHAQDLVTVDGGLWVGGLICCLAYVATVVALRDPLFLYAMQGGVVLTLVLLLGDLGKITDPAWLSLFLMAMGLVALHAERAFAPEAPEFSRARYGLPLFRGGRVVIAGALLILLGAQVWGWSFDPLTAALADLGEEFTGTRPINLLVRSAAVAAGVWLAGAYAFLYSELVVRRSGYDLFNAAGCAAMAGVTVLLAAELQAEWYIAALAGIGLAANAAQLWLMRRDRADEASEPGAQGRVPKTGLLLNALPLALGAALHWRATSRGAAALGWDYETGWAFVAAMALVAVCNRLAAWLFRADSPRWSATCLFFTGAALLIGAAGLLRVFGLTDWLRQAPLLMLIPLAYLAAGRLWRAFAPERGRALERPLYWVAEGGAAVILAHVVYNALRDLATLTWISGERTNLWLGGTFLLAAAFYFLAALWRGDRRFNIPAGAACAAAALWQGLGYWNVPDVWHPAIYALLGLAGILAGRWRGTELSFERPDEPVDLFPEEPVAEPAAVGHRWDRGAPSLRRLRDVRAADSRTHLIGPGAALFYCGAGVLLVAVLAAGLQGLARLAGGAAGIQIATLLVTAAASGAAAAFGPLPGWRRTFAVAAVALTGLAFLTLNVLLDLNGWRKAEIFCVAAGLIAVVAALVVRLKLFSTHNRGAGHEDLVGLALWTGSALATFPPLIAALVNRFGYGGQDAVGSGPADQLILITITVGLLVAGLTARAKAPTLLGGGALAVYLAVLIVSVAYRPQVAVGVYLGFGGLALFAAGALLSVYRDRLLSLPDRVAARDGLFRILDWR